MNTVVVFTIGDIIGLAILAIVLLAVAALLIHSWFTSPYRWWNRRKRD